MLLTPLLQSPKTSSKLVVCDPFRKPDQGELVQEVIGLANADVDGPRHILFGVNSAAMEGTGIVGIAESAMADLKQAHRLISTLIEPVLHLAFIYDRINGKLVGALEIDGCDDGPYVVGKNFSEKLSHGRCWVREGRQLRAVESGDLARDSEPEPAEEPAKSTETPLIEVGFTNQPGCELLEMPVPDTSSPPFDSKQSADEQPSKLKKAIKNTIETVTTQILRLQRSPAHSGAVESNADGIEVQVDNTGEAEALFNDANNHYFFEEKALQLSLSVCNKSTQEIEGVRIKLGFPKLTDFDIADRVYVSPFDRSSTRKSKNLDYPDVRRYAESIMVYSSIGTLKPDVPAQAFKRALRLAVGPEMQRRKIAIRYTLFGQDEQVLGKGLLKIKFGRISA